MLISLLFPDYVFPPDLKRWQTLLQPTHLYAFSNSGIRIMILTTILHSFYLFFQYCSMVFPILLLYISSNILETKSSKTFLRLCIFFKEKTHMFCVTGMRKGFKIQQQKHLEKRITSTWLESHLVPPEGKGKTYICYLLCVTQNFSSVTHSVLKMTFFLLSWSWSAYSSGFTVANWQNKAVGSNKKGMYFRDSTKILIGFNDWLVVEVRDRTNSRMSHRWETE